MKIRFIGDIDRQAMLLRLEREGCLIEVGPEPDLEPDEVPVYSSCAEWLPELPGAIGHSRYFSVLNGPDSTRVLKAYGFPLKELNGVPFIFGVWWDGVALRMPSFNVFDIEFLPGGGYGESGLVSYRVRAEAKLLGTLAEPLRELLSRQTYRGPVALLCRATTERGMSVESIATGLDTMLTYTACELWNWPLGALLDALRTGTVDRPSRGWLATCVAIRTAEPVVSEHSQVWPCNGGAYICARGNGLSEGLRRAYHTIERLLPEDEMRYSPSVGVSATSIRNRLKWWL